MYSFKSIVPLDELRNKDLFYLNLAINRAEESKFDSSKRMGACIVEGKGILCG
jgi:hypothetical protein